MNRILRWLSNKNIVKLKIIKDNKMSYCPLCLSDIKETVRGTVTKCPTCGAKIYSNC